VANIRSVSFYADGLKLDGDLCLPPDYQEGAAAGAANYVVSPAAEPIQLGKVPAVSALFEKRSGAGVEPTQRGVATPDRF
jgi:hypothetical protein